MTTIITRTSDKVQHDGHPLCWFCVVWN